MSSTGRRPRLLFVVTTESTARAFLPPIVGALEDQGFEVHLAFSPDFGDTSKYGASAVHPLRLKRSANPLELLRAVSGLRRIISQVRPQVCLGATPVGAFLACALARVLRVPTVIYLAWGLRSESLSGPARKLVELAERLTTVSAHLTLANSKSLARVVSQTSGRSVETIGSGSSHGVDLDRFKFVDRVEPGPCLRVGFVGRVRRDKGAVELVRAVEILNAEGVPVILEVTGVVEDQVVGRLVEEAPNCRLRPPTERVEQVMSNLDVLCLPSWREGFPNVVLEAAATGLPAVVSDATGAVDSVLDGVTGRVVPVRNPDQLAAALRSLAEDPQERQKMGLAARERVEREFEQRIVCRMLAKRIAEATL